MGKLTNLNPASVQEYLPANPTSIEFGLANVNFIDFHLTPPTGIDPSTVDFDARMIVTEGIGQNGRAKVALQASLFNIIGKFSVGGGAQIARLLMADLLIDLPSIAPGAVHHIDVDIAGVVTGDIAFFVPTTDLYNGLWCFNIQSVVIGASKTRLYFQNLYSAALNIVSFPGKLLVIGF